MNDNAQRLYVELKNKKPVIVELAKMFYIEEISIRNNWFSNSKAIPEPYLPKVVEVLQNAIFEENKINDIEVNTEKP